VIDWINEAHRFLAGLCFDYMCGEVGVRAIRLAADSLITLHQFEKARRIADGMDLADLVGVNGRDWD